MLGPGRLACPVGEAKAKANRAAGPAAPRAAAAARPTSARQHVVSTCRENDRVRGKPRPRRRWPGTPHTPRRQAHTTFGLTISAQIGRFAAIPRAGPGGPPRAAAEADAAAALTRLHDEQESPDLAVARPCARRRGVKRQNGGLTTLGHV